MGRQQQMEQLLGAVAALTESLRDEEMRRQRLEKRQRWIVAVGLGALLLMGWEPGTRALAENPPAVPASQHSGLLPAHLLQHLDELAVNLNTTVTTLNQLTAHPQVLATAQNLGILAQRFKQDSDLVRQHVLSQTQPGVKVTTAMLESPNASPAVILHQLGVGVNQELNFINRNIADMDFNIRVMAQSMGTTLGRVGSWIPF